MQDGHRPDQENADDEGLDDDRGLGEAAGPDFAAPPADPVPRPASGVGPGRGLPADDHAQTPGHATTARATEHATPPRAATDPAPNRPASRGGALAWVGRHLRLVTSLVTVVVLLVSVAVLVVPRLLTLSAGLPPGPAAAPFTPLPAQPMSTAYFAFTSPDGWARAADWGTANDAGLVDRAGNTIRVYHWQDDDAADRCRRELSALQIWEPGEISSVPSRQVGSRAAPGGMLVGTGEVYVLRCVAYRGQVFNMSSKADPDDVDTIATAYDAVLDSWTWT